MTDEERADAREQAKQDARKRLQLGLDYESTFSTPNGKRVLVDLIRECMVFYVTFTGNSKSFFLQGKQSIGLHILVMLKMANPENIDQVIEFLKELEDIEADIY